MRYLAIVFMLLPCVAMAQGRFESGTGNQIVVPMGPGGSGPVPVTGTISSTPPATTPSSMSASTVTTGGTFQQALAANAARTSCSIQNTSTHTAFVYWLATGTATLLNSLQVAQGQTFFCQNPVGAPIKTAIQWTTATTADPFVVAENQ